jgi:serine/threonine protein kinase
LEYSSVPSDEPTIVQPSGAEGQEPPPATVERTVAPASEISGPGEDMRTPAINTPQPPELDKTINQDESDRQRSIVRSSPEPDATMADGRAEGPADETAPTVPGYMPVRKLGEGTFGKVWLFEAVPSGKRVAVKFFTRGATQQWQVLQAEIMQLARLFGDPGIVQLQDLEPDARPPYCILTYAEGGSLADLLKNGPIPVANALQIFREAATALAYVHAKGIIHCDLKPGNVLRDARGRALLADFGQAHLMSDLTPALGTFFYMAPEQADLAVTIPDTRWDVYALGALFFALVTGKPPRDDPALRAEIGKTPELPRRLRIYRDAVRTAPKPDGHRRLPGMDRRLALIIDDCLESDPARRLRDGGAIVDALNRRARARRLRPVFFFGLLVPTLMLLATAVLALSTGRSALHRAEDALVERRLEDSKVMAQMVANVVEARIDYRLGLLDDLLKRDNQLRLAMAAQPVNREQVRASLEAFRKRLDEQEAAKGELRNWLLFAVFVADRDGRIVTRNPHDGAVEGRNWSWRGWFNGEGDKHGHFGESFPISDKRHVSQPYVYRGQGGDDVDPVVIALSLPIRAVPDGPVLGRLVGVLKVKELHSALEGIGLRDRKGCIVLVNEQRHLLYHGLHGEEVLRRLPRDDDPQPLPYDPAVFGPNNGATGVAANYVDALDNHEYLAAYATLKNRDWRVIVQYDRERTLAPSRDLAAWMRNVGVVALIGAVLFITLLFVLLVKTLRRGENAAHA